MALNVMNYREILRYCELVSRLDWGDWGVGETRKGRGNGERQRN